MHADCAYMIGATHSVCEDYALSKNSQDQSHVIISDGCSTSPHTDVGARLLVWAATQQLSNNNDDDIEALHERAAQKALEWTKEIGLPPQSVDATLLTAICRDGELIIGATGDGVIILQSSCGTIDAYSISFPTGFPFYPAYECQPERLGAWHKSTSAPKEIRHFQASGVFGQPELVETSTSTKATETLILNANAYKHVAVVSDGLHSFYKAEDSETAKHLTSIPMDQVLAQTIAFKGGRGAFVGRRMKKFSRQCELNGWHHADDLAIGAIYFGD